LLYQPITEDPDVADAVELFRPTVIEIRVRSAELFSLGDTSPHRDDVRGQIEDLVATMALRCERLDITLDDLFRMVNADLAARPPVQGHAHKPIGEYERALVDENTRAHAAERAANAEVMSAQQRLKAAVDSRVEADRACAGYVAAWAIRGLRS
jgi:hypothetical protein